MSSSQPPRRTSSPPPVSSPPSTTSPGPAGALSPERVHLLHALDPGAPLDDLEAVGDLIGDARVVAIGEGAHFVEEFWTFRQRLVRYLHERCGFTVLALEFGIAEAIALTPWLDGRGAVQELATLSPAAADWGAGETMRWLRGYNAACAPGSMARVGAPAQRPVTLVGIDLPAAGGSLAPALDLIADYLRAVDADTLAILQGVRVVSDRLDGGSGVRTAGTWTDLTVAQQDAVLAGLSQLELRMAAMEPRYRSAADTLLPYPTAMRLVAAALSTAYSWQAASRTASGSGLQLDASARERFLADSVMDQLARLPKGSRIVLAAHNNHVQKTPAVFPAIGDQPYAFPMGAYLTQWLGGDYRVIAQTHTAEHVPEMVIDPTTRVGFRVLDTPLLVPEAGSLEAAVLASGRGEQLTLTDLRPGDGLPILDRLRTQSSYVRTNLPDAFDGAVTHPTITKQTDLGF